MHQISKQTLAQRVLTTVLIIILPVIITNAYAKIIGANPDRNASHSAILELSDIDVHTFHAKTLQDPAAIAGNWSQYGRPVLFSDDGARMSDSTCQPGSSTDFRTHADCAEQLARSSLSVAAGFEHYATVLADAIAQRALSLCGRDNSWPAFDNAVLDRLAQVGSEFSTELELAPGGTLTRSGNQLLWNGIPKKLLGFSVYGAVVLKANDNCYQNFLQTLANHNLNFTRVWVTEQWTTLGSQTANPGGQEYGHSAFTGSYAARNYDLNQINPSFLDKLEGFIAAASARGIVVQLALFDRAGLTLTNDIIGGVKGSPYNNTNNVQSFINLPQNRGEFTNLSAPINPVQRNLIDAIRNRLSGYGNVIYEVMNEPLDLPNPGPWHAMVANQVRDSGGGTNPGDCVSAPEYDYQIISSNAGHPDSLFCGDEPRQISITVKNTGTATWDLSGRFKLGVRSYHDPANSGVLSGFHPFSTLHRAPITGAAASAPIACGDSVTLQFPLNRFTGLEVLPNTVDVGGSVRFDMHWSMVFEQANGGPPVSNPFWFDAGPVVAGIAVPKLQAKLSPALTSNYQCGASTQFEYEVVNQGIWAWQNPRLDFSGDAAEFGLPLSSPLSELVCGSSETVTNPVTVPNSEELFDIRADVHTDALGGDTIPAGSSTIVQVECDDGGPGGGGIIPPPDRPCDQSITAFDDAASAQRGRSRLVDVLANDSSNSGIPLVIGSVQAIGQTAAQCADVAIPAAVFDNKLLLVNGSPAVAECRFEYAAQAELSSGSASASAVLTVTFSESSVASLEPELWEIGFGEAAYFDVFTDISNINAYQWYRNGLLVEDQDAARFEIPAVGEVDVGQYYVDLLLDDGRVISSSPGEIRLDGLQRPYFGEAIQVQADGVTTIQAEHFDLGGQEIAYFDLTPEPTGAGSRPNEAVEIFMLANGAQVVRGLDGVADGGPGNTPEWLEYSIQVLQSGQYSMSATINNAPGTLTITVRHPETDQVLLTRSVSFAPGVPGTYRNVPIFGTVFSGGGQYVLRATFSAGDFSLDNIRLAAGCADSAPFVPRQYSPDNPLSIRAWQYDIGCGAYYDIDDNRNQPVGFELRADELVDLRKLSHGAVVVDETADQEWLHYTFTTAAGFNSDSDLDISVQPTLRDNAAAVRVKVLDASGQTVSGPTTIYPADHDRSRPIRVFSGISLGAGQPYSVELFNLEGGAILSEITLTPAVPAVCYSGSVAPLQVLRILSSDLTAAVPGVIPGHVTEISEPGNMSWYRTGNGYWELRSADPGYSGVVEFTYTVAYPNDSQARCVGQVSIQPDTIVHAADQVYEFEAGQPIVISVTDLAEGGSGGVGNYRLYDCPSLPAGWECPPFAETPLAANTQVQFTYRLRDDGGWGSVSSAGTVTVLGRPEGSLPQPRPQDDQINLPEYTPDALGYQFTPSLLQSNDTFSGLDPADYRMVFETVGGHDGTLTLGLGGTVLYRRASSQPAGDSEIRQFRYCWCPDGVCSNGSDIGADGAVTGTAALQSSACGNYATALITARVVKLPVPVNDPDNDPSGQNRFALPFGGSGSVLFDELLENDLSLTALLAPSSDLISLAPGFQATFSTAALTVAPVPDYFPAEPVRAFSYAVKNRINHGPADPDDDFAEAPATQLSETSAEVMVDILAPAFVLRQDGANSTQGLGAEPIVIPYEGSLITRTSRFLENDSLPQASYTRMEIVDGPAVVAANGEVTITAPPGYEGELQIVYRVLVSVNAAPAICGTSPDTGLCKWYTSQETAVITAHVQAQQPVTAADVFSLFDVDAVLEANQIISNDQPADDLLILNLQPEDHEDSFDDLGNGIYRFNDGTQYVVEPYGVVQQATYTVSRGLFPDIPPVQGDIEIRYPEACVSSILTSFENADIPADWTLAGAPDSIQVVPGASLGPGALGLEINFEESSDYRESVRIPLPDSMAGPVERAVPVPVGKYRIRSRLSLHRLIPPGSVIDSLTLLDLGGQAGRLSLRVYKQPDGSLAGELTGVGQNGAVSVSGLFELPNQPFYFTLEFTNGNPGHAAAFINSWRAAELTDINLETTTFTDVLIGNTATISGFNSLGAVALDDVEICEVQ